VKYISKIKNWKKKNIIGVTNGCFDLLHKGHIYSLKQCKKHCDKLIVLLNSDKSVKKLKGIGRPIDNQKLRKKKILGTKLVDYVIIFNELTPYKVIKSLKPNYLFKGSDYKNKKIIGKNYVKSYGGKIKILKNLKSISTTKLIKHIYN
jgi:D-beta-D-heptose 7-phosphate kinase/D-beta-D-heptose 1-phosphate adenosyltransferase|tara:strand:- start:205 stop:648 length:444 start_codon:yes stop_codon:yes gene_type:complete